MFAAIINHTYYRLAGLGADASIEAPPETAAVGDLVLSMIEREARAWFGDVPEGLFLILDDAESLARGHFRPEHELLAALLRSRGWQTAIGAPEELSYDGGALRHRDREVGFVVNRSTDFLWRADVFEPLRRACAETRVYVAPNPFTYVTRSDKRLLEPLSLSERDAELGILPDERAMLVERVPETRLVREADVDELARRKDELFFKPLYGYAGRGVIPSSQIGRTRLRRLLRDDKPYVAQRFVSKGRLSVPGADAEPLWTDLRVWAHRGKRYQLSGRASCRSDRLDLSGGGWIPTFATTAS